MSDHKELIAALRHFDSRKWDRQALMNKAAAALEAVASPRGGHRELIARLKEVCAPPEFDDSIDHYRTCAHPALFTSDSACVDCPYCAALEAVSGHPEETK